MECNQAKELLSMYIDDLLDKAEKEKLKEHLDNCSQCQQELKSLQDVLGLLDKMDEMAPPEGFRKEIINKLQGIKPEPIVNEKETIKFYIKEKLNKFKSSKIAKISSVAAGILLIASISYIMQSNPLFDVQNENIASIDGEMAYERAGSNSPTANGGSSKGSPKVNYPNKDVYSGENKSVKLGGIPSNYDRKVIKNGSMVIETKEFDKTVSSIDIILQKVQGYYENKNVNSEGETKSGDFTLRIPAPKFLEVTAQMEKLGKVNNKSITGNDVTTEYYDTKARIKVLKQQEERLIAILKKAKDVNEILSVENELRRIREEIEINEANMKVLDNNIGMSTLNLQITEVKEITHITPPGIKGTILQAWQAFIASVNGILKLLENLVIFLGGALPFLAIIALGITGYLYYHKRKPHK